MEVGGGGGIKLFWVDIFGKLISGGGGGDVYSGHQSMRNFDKAL